MTCLCKWFLFTFAKTCIFTILLLFLALVSFPAAYIHQSCFYVGYFFLRGQISSSSSFSLSLSLAFYFTSLSVSLVSGVCRWMGQKGNARILQCRQFIWHKYQQKWDKHFILASSPGKIDYIWPSWSIRQHCQLGQTWIPSCFTPFLLVSL